MRPAKETAAESFRLETPRLVLRYLAERDLAAHVATRADPELRRYQGFPETYSEAEASRFFAWMEAHDPAAGGWFNLCIAEKDGDRHAGDVAVKVEGKKAQLGATLERRAQGRGYATEALHALIAWLAERGIEEFSAEIDARNSASIALFAERLGFKKSDSYKDGDVLVRRYRRQLVSSGPA